MRLRIAVSLVLVCLLALAMLAQSSQPRTGSLSGTVRDGNGTVLPGVAVTVTGQPLGAQSRATKTDARGQFAIQNLPAGTYRLQFVRDGFKTHVREAVTVSAGAARTLTIQLIKGSTSEVVVGPRDSSSQSKNKMEQGKQRTQPLPAPPSPPASASVGAAPLAGAAAVAAPGGVAGGVPGGVPGGSAQLVVPFSAPFVAPDVYAPGGRAYPGQESYAAISENPFHAVGEEPLSTFSIDTDTASYANVRRFLNAGTLPPHDAVRIEELVNYFHFDYPQPRSDVPFSITTELAAAPWDPTHRVALIGLQGREVANTNIPPRNLVFLLDVSGSMAPADRLPLVRQAMRMLVDILRPQDRVAIVVYAGSSGLALPSTPGSQKETIHEAIARLEAGGSTNGGEGLRLAYKTARANFIQGGINRVILATDGDFNVGVTSQSDLLSLIENERKSGVFLSVLGVGTGNLKDSTMEMLADKGNGNYAYLDSLQEARRVLVREAGSTLMTIAKDVKIQVEFNPATVAAYRLIGYENRLLRKEDFNDDRKDAGEIGAGHSVTALYEIVPVGAKWSESVDPLKYQRPPQQPERTVAGLSNELVTVKLRYKPPSEDVSRLISTVIENRPQPLGRNLGFASAVAEFGMLLRDSPHKANASFDAAITRARQFRGEDAEGYRAEFVRLADLAAGLTQTKEGIARATP
jgi:Ca-activated chloride channel family protein